MIRDAFHDTDFSVPSVNIQPEGDVTLVNLPTFFEVRFPDAGFGPDEVDTPDPARLLGYRIEVRPQLKSITYHLGTTSIGPTTSLGGPHPAGDIRATYSQPGTHQGQGRHRLHRPVPGGRRPVVRHPGGRRPAWHPGHPDGARGDLAPLHQLNARERTRALGCRLPDARAGGILRPDTGAPTGAVHAG